MKITFSLTASSFYKIPHPSSTPLLTDSLLILHHRRLSPLHRRSRSSITPLPQSLSFSFNADEFRYLLHAVFCRCSLKLVSVVAAAATSSSRRLHALNKLPYSKLSSKSVGVKDGVVFSTYISLIASSDKGQSRLKQLVQWCGPKFDGLIIFDECHKAKNLMPEAKGGMQPTQTGKAASEAVEYHYVNASDLNLLEAHEAEASLAGRGAYTLMVGLTLIQTAAANNSCQVRRTKISERMRKLQDLVPNMDKQTNTADMLDLAVDYVKELQNQVETLSDSQAKCTCAHKKQQ
ncbi:hypothetical protein Ahy_B01g056968 isoform J [Arachis hypogaea]|uniref:BHLH domain-containing protein n=1 Tax=Arachis hypogaea TaxID=3818 RepID=A0A445AZW8_ARAHY|nr:hypothetical protein Ahy_B01g056968 isoform J [Arachis hypogaea]